ncbi:hypothetical protein [Streptosporangium sp. NPDC051022]|uniref:hypothetical protein n=1 Tax=Streptosporangium sp. NPDC051022 TaxID=3155752 RepID=UPI0034371CFD
MGHEPAVHRDESRARGVLNRPEAHNALSGTLPAELERVVCELDPSWTRGPGRRSVGGPHI